MAILIKEPNTFRFRKNIESQLKGRKLESHQNYKSAYITLKISESINQIFSESSKRSSRKKTQKRSYGLPEHFKRFRSI